MYFPWNKYREVPVERRATLQIFITSRCNYQCPGCFARNIMKDELDMDVGEYIKVISVAKEKGAKQINILGGEPLLHPNLIDFVNINRLSGFKTTIYTNGKNLWKYNKTAFYWAKLRVSIYQPHGAYKTLDQLSDDQFPVEMCYMVSATTTVDDLLEVINDRRCKLLFISSIREMDNPRKEFFDDTMLSMPVLKYKELVHEFLNKYEGKKDIHVSKRGVFESTVTTAPCNQCYFANYIVGGKYVQCPYDLVNLKFQTDYEFGKRFCQQNSTCLMSKVIYRPI